MDPGFGSRRESPRPSWAVSNGTRRSSSPSCDLLMEKLVFVGPGRVGLSLAHALVLSEGRVSVTVVGRHPDPPEHALFRDGLAEYRFGLERPQEGTTAVLLTVPDEALAEVSVALAEWGDAPRGCAVFHCSGALGADPLAPLHARGYAVGTLHPLEAIPLAMVGADRLRGAFFALSGEPDALFAARRLVSLLSGQAISVPTSRRPLYHAAAVMASNYVVLLLHEATRLFEQAGVSRKEAEEALTGLAQGALENVAKLGVDRALTGPLIRGDVETIALHLRTLEPEDARLYAELGRRGLAWVGARLPEGSVDELTKLFDRYS
ncbi:MAG: DUF2520 domain-containing protein [Gemmatimonadetes bacterium]|nr:DUF2520 domain-containing protein [Gemmatimonadota bacterium]